MYVQDKDCELVPVFVELFFAFCLSHSLETINVFYSKDSFEFLYLRNIKTCILCSVTLFGISDIKHNLVAHLTCDTLNAVAHLTLWHI